MSLEIIKSGMLDTLQDGGRFGYQHVGINPNGPMDYFSMRLANALVGNDLNEGVIEMCFPAARIRFLSSAIISITGADFSATVNGKPVSSNRPFAISAGTEIRFKKNTSGRFAYLAVRGGFQIQKWLGSVSTNLKAKAGGLGRALEKGDQLNFNQQVYVDETKIFPWYFPLPRTDSVIRCLKGNEYKWLTDLAQHNFFTQSCSISPMSDRMAYRLEGIPLVQTKKRELLSTVAHFGTVQLLPNGQLICLMADHQTTGGYPRIAQVIVADLPKLAQRNSNEIIRFSASSVAVAEDESMSQANVLRQIQMACQLCLK